jgi:hypothetical protein
MERGLLLVSVSTTAAIRSNPPIPLPHLKDRALKTSCKMFESAEGT